MRCRAYSDYRGVITIFMACLLPILLSLVFVTLESVYLRAKKMSYQIIADTTVDALFASYDKELWSKYGILLFHRDHLKKMESLLLQEEGVESEMEAFNEIYAMDDDNAYIEYEILEYMKYGIFESVKDKIKKYEESQDEVNDAIWQNENQKKKAKTTSSAQITIAPEGSVQNVAFSQFGYSKSASLLSRNLPAALLLFQWELELPLKQGSSTHRLRGGGLPWEVKKLSSESVQTTSEDDYQEDIDKAQKEFESSDVGLVDQILEWTLFPLFFKDPEKLSAWNVDLDNFPSKQQGETKNELSNKGFLEGTEANLLIGEYGILFMKNILDVKASNEEAEGLQYEQEYLVGGFSGDRSNLLWVLGEMLIMRQGYNLMHILTDTQKRTQALNYARLFVGWIPISGLSEMLAATMMSAWAQGEAILDVRALLEGKKLPLIKTKETWTLPLMDMTRILFSKESGKTSQEGGMSYEDYLRIQLMLVSRSRKVKRIMDIITLNYRREDENFDFRNMVYAINMSLVAEVKPLFSRFIFLLEPHQKSKKYQFVYVTGRSY